MADFEATFTLDPQPEIEADFNIDVQGITEHNLLINRDLPNQHPMSAITGLSEALSGKQNTLVAGLNVQIDGNVISATDTTYTAGSGIDITNGVISNTQTSAEWGNITGTLSAQTDLKNALDTLDGKIDSNHSAITEIALTMQSYGNIVTHNVSEFATSAQGSLADSALQPNDNISELTNNVGYITSTALEPYVLASTLATVATSGSYTDLSNKPSIPTKTSDLTNDSGYITTSALSGYATTTYVDTGLGGKQDTLTTTQLAAVNSGATSTNIAQIATNTQNITDETTNRQNADNNLQSQIDAITAASDVTDIVGTYAELQAYDTTSLPNNSIIKVLQDESRNNETTYYRWVITGGVGAWSLIGEEGPYYTKSEADTAFVPQTRTINGKALSANISLSASDVGALPDSTVIPTVNNATLTIQKNGTNVQTFTANASSDVTANITVPTDTSDLTNTAGYITSSALNGYATESWVGQQGYITGITSSDVTTALGYTPYDASNPSGYTTNVGTVTSVNNVSPVSGNVTLSIPTDTSDLTNGAGYITSSALSPYALSSSLATVATSGSYTDLSNKPTIPTVNNATLTITQGGVSKGTFTANASSDVTIALDAGGGSTYTAGTGIDITSNAISVKYDNSTITVNASGQLQAAIEAFTANEVQTIWESV